MEPKNHPIEKENHLPNHPLSGSMLVFRGVVRHLVKPRILTSAPGKFHKSIPPGSKRFCSAAQLPRLQKKLSKLWFS